MSLAKNIIRNKNKHDVKSLLFQQGTVFAADLVKQTGISLVTINSLLKELVAEQVVFEGEIVPQTIGRPAINYHFNYDFQHSLLLSIQEASASKLCIKSTLVNLKGAPLKEETFDFSTITLKNFITILQTQLAENPTVKNIGILLPGKIYHGVIQSSWYEKFDGWPINQAIEAVTDLPFSIQNDAHVITIGYCVQQKISLDETIVGIFYPQRSMPGITLFAKHQLLEGNQALAGEAKYLPGFLNRPLPTTEQELAERLSDLLPFYNAAIAPNRFIISSNTQATEYFKDVLANNPLLPLQANQPTIDVVADFEACILLGLRWLINQGTAFDLSIT